MSLYYPLYLNVTGRLCAVVGGGSVAERKVTGLLEAGALARVVSPSATEHLLELAVAGQIEYVRTDYAPKHLDGTYLAFAATNIRSVNACVAADAAARGIPVNVADAPEDGDFITPAVVRRGDFCLSLTTGGNSPALSARLSDEFETRFGPEYGDFVELLGEMRDTIKEWTPELPARRQLMAAILDREMELRERIASGHRADALALARSIAQDASGIATHPGDSD